MKTSGPQFRFALAFLALSAGAIAQSPREQLQQMVEQLQKTPTDNALRERVIKLGAEIKPPPAIPEEANRSFVRGNVFQKGAKDASGYELAIFAYRDALRVAPWWGDAYFNLSAAQEAAGRFDEAIASLKSYMASVSGGGAEAREAQNHIYAMEAKGEMASRQAAVTAQQAEKANSPQARAAVLLQKVEGARFVDDGERATPSGYATYDEIFEIRAGTLYRSARIYSLGTGNTRRAELYGHDQPGLYSVDSALYRDDVFTTTKYGGTCVYRIKPDGQALLKRCSHWPSQDPDSAIPRQ